MICGGNPEGWLRTRFVNKPRARGLLRREEPAWRIVYPKVFQDEDMLIAARRQLTQCGGRPMLMGRSGAAYEALMILTEMAERYSAQAQGQAAAS
jgi:hypothetical protein